MATSKPAAVESAPVAVNPPPVQPAAPVEKTPEELAAIKAAADKAVEDYKESIKALGPGRFETDAMGKIPDGAKFTPDTEPAPKMEVFTYPDGSVVHGCPPFPELSPIQRAAALNREHAAAHGVLLSPPVAPIVGNAGMVTANAFENRGQ